MLGEMRRRCLCVLVVVGCMVYLVVVDGVDGFWDLSTHGGWMIQD
jgi:hypothetical protein